jgi:hypothetical protein
VQPFVPPIETVDGVLEHKVGTSHAVGTTIETKRHGKIDFILRRALIQGVLDTAVKLELTN